MAVVWLSAWVIGYFAVSWRKEFNQDFSLTTDHKAVASTIIFLTVIRILWRLTHPTPPLPDSMTSVMKRMAQGAHFILYAIALVLLPLTGWMWSSVADKPIMLLWIFHLPPLVSPHPEYYNLAKYVHLTLAWSMGALVVGHILLALKHALIDKDGVMQSMLPFSTKTPAAKPPRQD